jgi:alpha-N-arabinofuranosidase
MAGIIINARRSKGTVNRNIFGHFSEHLGRCIYQGIYVGEDSKIPNVDGMRRDVVQALRAIRIPRAALAGRVLRRRVPLAGRHRPKGLRKRMVNTNWGHVVEDNSFGTHEFMNLCRQLGCEPYVTATWARHRTEGNGRVGEYLNSDGNSSVVEERHQNGQKAPFGVRYFGVGNESWVLRRQHAPRKLRRRVPPLPDLLPRLRRQQAFPHRLRPLRRGLPLDGRC